MSVTVSAFTSEPLENSAVKLPGPMKSIELLKLDQLVKA